MLSIRVCGDKMCGPFWFPRGQVKTTDYDARTSLAEARARIPAIAVMACFCGCCGGLDTETRKAVSLLHGVPHTSMHYADGEYFRRFMAAPDQTRSNRNAAHAPFSVLISAAKGGLLVDVLRPDQIEFVVGVVMPGSAPEHLGPHEISICNAVRPKSRIDLRELRTKGFSSVVSGELERNWLLGQVGELRVAAHSDLLVVCGDAGILSRALHKRLSGAGVAVTPEEQWIRACRKRGIPVCGIRTLGPSEIDGEFSSVIRRQQRSDSTSFTLTYTLPWNRSTLAMVLTESQPGVLAPVEIVRGGQPPFRRVSERAYEAMIALNESEESFKQVFFFMWAMGFRVNV